MKSGKLATSQPREFGPDLEASSGAETQVQGKNHKYLLMILSWALELASQNHLKSLVVQKASPPNCTFEGREACRWALPLNSSWHLSSQAAATACNPLDGTTSPAVSRAMDQQWCQKCLRPYPTHPTPSSQQSSWGGQTHRAQR